MINSNEKIIVEEYAGAGQKSREWEEQVKRRPEERTKPSSPINEALEELEKEMYAMTDNLQTLFKKLTPCINEHRLQKNPNKGEVEPNAPKSIFRERINVIKDMIERNNKDINLIIETLEL